MIYLRAPRTRGPGPREFKASRNGFCSVAACSRCNHGIACVSHILMLSTIADHNRALDGSVRECKLTYPLFCFT